MTPPPIVFDALAIVGSLTVGAIFALVLWESRRSRP